MCGPASGAFSLAHTPRLHSHSYSVLTMLSLAQLQLCSCLTFDPSVALCWLTVAGHLSRARSTRIYINEQGFTLATWCHRTYPMQCLPLRCRSSALVGTSNVELLHQCKLNFVNSIINLDEDSLARKLLLARASAPKPSGATLSLLNTLEKYQLPDLPNLLTKPPSWKFSIRKQLNIHNAFDEYHISEL